MPNSNKVLYDPNLHVIFLITMMAVLGVSSITPAFPKIGRELNIPPQSIGLLIMIFTLPGVVLTPVLGVVADRVSRKKVLAPSLFLFGISGALCGFARNFELLLFFRLLQGIGAASLGAINFTLIGDLFAGARRAEAMGYNASVLNIAVASYPFIGGLLAAFAWYYPFFLSLFAVPIALIVLFRLKNPEPDQVQSLGAYLKNALSTLKDRHAILYFSTSMVVFILLYGSYLTYGPIYLAAHFGATPVQIGLVMSCVSITTALVSAWTGKLSRRFGEKKLLLISFLFYALSFLLFVRTKSMLLAVLFISIFGIGQGLNMPTLQTLLAGLAPIEYRAAFLSMNGMVLRLGQTLGPLIMGALFVLGGGNTPFYAGAIIGLIMFFVLFVGLRER